MTVIETVLFDLDGVIRHFDPDHRVAVEARHGLAEGALEQAAMNGSAITRLVTGKMTRAEWEATVGQAVGNATAAEEWLADRGVIDDEAMALVDELRLVGRRVAILTNGTDTISDELASFGITERFDAVFNTADIGAAKPDPRAFRHVCQALDADPATVFFTDDSPAKLDGAIQLGMTARTFIGVSDCRAALIELGVPVSPATASP